MTFRISQRTFEELVSSAPAIESLEASWISENAPNIFICAQGFEDRFEGISNLVCQSGVRLDHVIVLSLKSNTDKDRENGEKLIHQLAPISQNRPVIINADDSNFALRMGEVLGAALSDREMPMHILFDISVAANRLCLRTLKFLMQINAQLTIAYSEALKYYPLQDSFESDPRWMADDGLGTEKGVEDISPCEEFLGEHLDAASNVVLLFANFRHERSAAIISHVDPALLVRPNDDVIWILGRPHLDDDYWRTEAMRKINRIEDNAKVYDASTFDYRDAWRILESIHGSKWESSNITLSPLGSKMQSLSVVFFCIRHPDVRVLLSIPKVYNAQQWSEGVRARWKVCIGNTEQFLNRLLNVGILSVEELPQH